MTTPAIPSPASGSNVRIATDRRLLVAAAAVLVVLLEIRHQTNGTMLMRTGY